MKKIKFPKGEKKKKEPIIYNGVQYDSEYEKLFAMWIEEGVEYGYILKAVYHPVPFILCDSTVREYQAEGKKKMIDKTEAMFKKIIYTADWWIYWTQKAIDKGLVGALHGKERSDRFPLMYQNGTSLPYSVIDVKPPVKMGGHNASYRDFGIKAPLIYSMFDIYIQSIVPVNTKKPEDCFFSRTWAPRCYLERVKKNGNGYLMNYCLQKTIEDYEKR
jgi:hypothetical protein